MENNLLTLLGDISLSLKSISASLEKIANTAVLPNIEASLDTYPTACNAQDEKSEEVLVIVDELPGNSTEISNDPSLAIGWLRQHGVYVEGVNDDESNSILERIAFFMGSRYNDIKNVYGLIKKNLNSHSGFKLNLQSASQIEVANTCQFCTMLHNIAFLSEYKYAKSPKFLLTGTTNKIPQAINFLTGHWLEDYVKCVVEKQLQQLRSEGFQFNSSYLKNAQVSFINGDKFEMDYCLLVNNELCWIEAKTGDYQNAINKYSKIATNLGISPKHVILVLSDVPETSDNTSLGLLYKMTVTTIGDFEQTVSSVLREIVES